MECRREGLCSSSRPTSGGFWCACQPDAPLRSHEQIRSANTFARWSTKLPTNQSSRVGRSGPVRGKPTLQQCEHCQGPGAHLTYHAGRADGEPGAIDQQLAEAEARAKAAEDRCLNVESQLRNERLCNEGATLAGDGGVSRVLGARARHRAAAAGRKPYDQHWAAAATQVEAASVQLRAIAARAVNAGELGDDVSGIDAHLELSTRHFVSEALGQ